MIHSLALRVLGKRTVKYIFETQYHITNLDGRVLNVESKLINNRTYRYLKCAFLINAAPTIATLALSSVKLGTYQDLLRQPVYPEHGSSHVINSL